MVAMTVPLCTPKVLQFEDYAWNLSVKVPWTHGMERRTYHAHTQYSGGGPSYRLPPSKWRRASRLGTQSNPQFVHGAVNKRQLPENQQAPTTFLGTTTHVSRDRSRVLDSAGFGNEEGTHVENIDAVELAEKLETLETSRLLDISGDLTSF